MLFMFVQMYNLPELYIYIFTLHARIRVCLFVHCPPKVQCLSFAQSFIFSVILSCPIVMVTSC